MHNGRKKTLKVLGILSRVFDFWKNQTWYENPLFVTSWMRQNPYVLGSWRHTRHQTVLCLKVQISQKAPRRFVTPFDLSYSWAVVLLCLYFHTCCFHFRKKKLFIWWYNGGVFLVLESHFCAMGCFGNNITAEERETDRRQRNTNKKIEKQLRDDKIAYRATHRLLLLGNNSRRVWLY